MNNELKIFLDLDGVLVNWSGGVCKLKNIDPYSPEAKAKLEKDTFLEGSVFGTTEDINDAVMSAGYDFWMNLELLPWAHALVNMCRKYGEVYFLTAPGLFHAGAHAKLDYIWKHFDSRNYILTKHKYLCANEHCILIDDMKKNIRQWTEAGGIPFLWTNQWKMMADPELVKKEFDLLQGTLEFHSGRGIEFAQANS